MSLGLRHSASRLAIMLLFAVPPSLWPSVPIQQGANSTGEVRSTSPTTPASPSDFEVKFAQGEVLVRQKGTSEWKPSSKLSEPVAVGVMDGDHKIYVGTKGIKPPKPTHMQPADYPPNEANLGMKRWVSLHIVVDEHGAVRFPSVDASPGPGFTQAALEAVKKWTFESAKLNNQPVAVLVSITMYFQ
jgi:TonB family protein